jgi:hypothetical protein
MLASIWAPKKVNSSGVGYATFRCAAPFIRDRRRPKASWSQAIEADGPAAENGFPTGDVILNVDGKAVHRGAGQTKYDILMRAGTRDATKFVALPRGHA